MLHAVDRKTWLGLPTLVRETAVAAVDQVGGDVAVDVAVDGEGSLLAEGNADQFIAENLARPAPGPLASAGQRVADRRGRRPRRCPLSACTSGTLALLKPVTLLNTTSLLTRWEAWCC